MFTVIKMGQLVMENNESMLFMLNIENKEQLFNLTLTIISLLDVMTVDGHLLCKRVELDAKGTKILSNGIRSTDTRILYRFCCDFFDLIKSNIELNINRKNKKVVHNIQLSADELNFIHDLFTGTESGMIK